MRAPFTARRLAATLAVCALLGLGAVRASGPAGSRPTSVQTPPALSDSAFAALVERISEPEGAFDTDNLVSNEDAYLKVMGALDRLDLEGGAYVGVGPDQSFSYIARVRPRVAFIIDIRRDNLLDHLLLKALFHRAPTRIEYLAGLFGRRPPPDPRAWRGRDVDALLSWVDSAPADPSWVRGLHEEIAKEVASHGVPLSEEDQTTIRRFHQAFIDAGPALRFHSDGRRPRSYYPTYADLARGTDLDGKEASFLAREDDYAFVRGLEESNRIVPVVGDLAGPHALRETGAALREMHLEVTAFYASNVEFYLWREGRFAAWAENLASLPAAPRAVLIRSYFPNRGRVHPSSVPGYHSTQTLQPVAKLLQVQEAGGFASYYDLVTRDAIPVPGPARR